MVSDPLTAFINAPITSQNWMAGVWRASQQALAPTSVLPTCHHALDRWLPGGGWPLGCLIEILIDSPGCGELTLVTPALAALPGQRPIVLLKPPAIPNALAWQQWRISSQRLWWLRPETLSDAWWSAQTVLQGGAFAALLAWIDPIDDRALRRLHASAQEAGTLLFLFRPKSIARQFSPSPLRIALTPLARGTVSVEVIKCKGRKPATPITVAPSPGSQSMTGEFRVGSHRTTALVS